MYRGATDTEVLRALLLERRHQRDVEVGPRIIAQCEQNLDLGRGVAHVELDRCVGNRPWCAIAADGVLAAAREGAKDVFVEAAGGRVDEFKVG